jgi:hypothetical protein
MRLSLGLLVAVTLALPLAAHAQATTEHDIFTATGFIDAEGRDWLPVGNLSLPPYQDIPTTFMESKCDVLTGVCNDGLHWASASEVAQMIAEATGEPFTTQNNDGAAAIALESYLSNTFWDGFGVSAYSGVTRDGFILDVSVTTDYLPPYTVTGKGDYRLRQCVDAGDCDDNYSTALAWVPVPEPSSLGLMGVGLAAVFLVRRRRIAES